MSWKFNPFTGTLDISGAAAVTTWKSPVADASSLPTTGNSDGDARVTLDTDEVWVWDANGSRWENQNIQAGTTPGSTPNSVGYSIDVNETVADLRTKELTLQPADSSNPGILSTGSQNIAGNKTFDNDVTVTGDLTVNGTTTTVNSATLDVTDANITVNNGGNQASADLNDAGITVEMSDATDAVIGYDSTLTSKFHIGEVGSEVEIADVSSAQTLTGKTIDADNNTLSNLAHGAEVDNPTSGVHGVTGNVVGTTDTQTLESKTIVAANNTITTAASGNLTSTELDAALAELQTDIDTRALASDLSDHISDPTDAHAASAITNTPSGNLSATDVQGALNELQTDVDTRALDADLTAHLNDTTDAHDASAISYDNATSSLTATDVQAAIDEVEGRLDTTELTEWKNSVIDKDTVDPPSGIANDYSIALAAGTDRAVVAPDASLQLADISVMIWIKASTGGFQNIVDSNDGAGHWAIWINGTTLNALVYDGSNIKHYQWFNGGSAAALLDGTWHHIGFTFASNTFKLYKDGVEETSVGIVTDNAVGSLATQAVGKSIYFGYRTPQANGAYTGNIDEASIWDKALSDAEVLETYNALDLSSHSSVGNLVTWLRMGDNDGGTGTTVTDNAGSNDATLTGATFDLDAPPVSGSLTTGDRYLIGLDTTASSATGAWATHDGEIAEWDGTAWQFTSPTKGMMVQADDEQDRLYNFDTTTWTARLFDSSAISGDIDPTSFSITNNQASAADVTGFAFANATTRSFTAHVSVEIDATADLFEVIEIKGIQRGADWVISQSSTGDSTGIVFTITSAGQIQYTSDNYAGFVSGTIKFRAITTAV